MSLIRTEPSFDRTKRDTLHLLVQSPTSLLAYWQLSDRKNAMVLEHFSAEWRTLRPTLRLYDITGIAFFDGSKAKSLHDFPLPEGESCFLSGLQQGLCYIADLGIWNKQDQFIPLLRSNSVSTLHAEGLDDESGGDTLANAYSYTLIKPCEYGQFSAYTVYAPRIPDSDHGGKWK